jgi:hypothetical protein
MKRKNCYIDILKEDKDLDKLKLEEACIKREIEFYKTSLLSCTTEDVYKHDSEVLKELKELLVYASKTRLDVAIILSN